MGKCYCDYCDVFLTNDSVTVRKQHNDGNRHKHNVCEYYRQYVGHQLQQQIDDLVAQFELDVARGLIRPTYGLPPVAKKPPADAPPPAKTGSPAAKPVSQSQSQSQSPRPDAPAPAKRATPPRQDAAAATPSPRPREPTPQSAAATPS